MENNKTIRSFIEKHQTAILIAIIALGCALRLTYLGQYPLGFNQDEASAGYDAWAMLNYGIDRNGISVPALFISWGSGQNVLYSYLSAPFIALLGLNEFSFRLLSAIVGCASLPLFYYIARKVRGGLFGLLAVLALAANPWHIMLSRWALESNLLPFFLLLGITFVILSLEKPYMLVAAGAAFGFSLYAYGTAFFFVPVFMLLCIIYMLKLRKLRLRAFLPALAVFLVIGLPIILTNLINILGWEQMKLFGMTLPRLPEMRMSGTTVFGAESASMWDNLKKLWDIFVTGSDGLLWNSIPKYGVIPFQFFALLGLGGCVVDLVKKKARAGDTVWLLALCACIISALFIDVNINRINMIFIPLIYFLAVGIWIAARAIQPWFGPAMACALVLYCTMFAHTYFTDYQTQIGTKFYNGLGDAIQFAEEQQSSAVWVTDTVNMPYVYVLFYNQVPPADFAGTVQYSNPYDEFRRVTVFTRYIFGGTVPPGSVVCVIHQTDPIAPGHQIIGISGDFYITSAAQ